jgi:hypothetical protein
MPPCESLDVHDIYLRKEETLKSLETFPAELQALFKLIFRLWDLQFDYFDGYEATNSDPSLVGFNPRLQYEKELKNEAV